MNNNELMHFGILGMKWGVRRYQNEDGTLTAAGKARISNRLAKETLSTKNRISNAKTNLTRNQEAYNDIDKYGTKSVYVEKAYNDKVNAEKNIDSAKKTELLEKMNNATDAESWVKANAEYLKYEREKEYKDWFSNGPSKAQIKAELMEDYSKKIESGKQYISTQNSRLKYLNSLNIDEISESGVGYRMAKGQIKNFNTWLASLYPVR